MEVDIVVDKVVCGVVVVADVCVSVNVPLNSLKSTVVVTTEEFNERECEGLYEPKVTVINR